MRILQRVWEDIRRGENIDLYVTVIVAIALAVLNLTGLAPQSWIAPLTLAVLGLLAIATLGNRHKVEEVINNLKQVPESPFLEKFPATLDRDMEKSTDLWLMGVTLSRTLTTYYSALERKLRRGGRVRALLVYPDGAGCEMALMRNYARSDLEFTRSQIRGVLGYLCDLKKIAPDRMEIRTIDYPLGFGAFAIDPDTASGVLYLEHYPFKTVGGSMPKFVLRAQDGRWYDFFKTEISILWENASPWKCQTPTGD